jgi:hypothetical protein
LKKFREFGWLNSVIARMAFTFAASKNSREGARPPRTISSIRSIRHVTTHYSAPEIGALVQASEKVC